VDGEVVARTATQRGAEDTSKVRGEVKTTTNTPNTTNKYARGSGDDKDQLD